MNFLESVKESFLTSLRTHVRSPEKLKVLHGFIAADLAKRLGKDYVVKSLGFQEGKESSIKGRYMIKNVDITVQKDGKNIAGIAVKFVMSNYAQNSNNYFENMLGETANIRTKNVPYFQVFVIPETIPYYQDGGKITRWENITSNNLDKYIRLSEDDVRSFHHTPDKMLFAIVSFGKITGKLPVNRETYKNYYLNNDFDISYSSQKVDFDAQTIYNDYEDYINKVYHAIKAI